MSSIYFDGYIQGKDERSHADISKILKHIEKREFSSIQDAFPDAVPLLACDTSLKNSSEENLSQIDHYWGDLETQESEGVLHIVLEAPTSLDDEEFIDILLEMNVAVLELRSYNSQVGEDAFYKLGKVYEEYADVEWKWLENDAEEIEESEMSSEENQETDGRKKPWWKLW